MFTALVMLLGMLICAQISYRMGVRSVGRWRAMAVAALIAGGATLILAVDRALMGVVTVALIGVIAVAIGHLSNHREVLR